MQQFDKLPRTVKKTVRYILQDADLEKLNEIENILTDAINKRKQNLLKKQK